MEVRADRVAVPAPPNTMVEFLAVRLILERLALAYVARETLGYDGPLNGLRQAALARSTPPPATNEEQRAFLVFQLAQVLGWCPEALNRLTAAEWSALVGEIEAFSSLERRRVFQLSFERRFRTQALDALSVYGRRRPGRVEAPRFQAVFCIDTRRIVSAASRRVGAGH